MKIGPIRNPVSPDCLPFTIDVDMKWLAQELAANPGKSPSEIILDDLYTGIARAMGLSCEQIAAINKAYAERQPNE